MTPSVPPPPPRLLLLLPPGPHPTDPSPRLRWGEALLLLLAAPLLHFYLLLCLSVPWLLAPRFASTFAGHVRCCVHVRVFTVPPLFAPGAAAG